ncbi:MAG: TraR/DksA family transcriptional regulator [Endomicrobium sp.]|jgi:DnaK suppressor protein|nr:TraR/DksA family transcriptional regulator [Endomicrobium sp.]
MNQKELLVFKKILIQKKNEILSKSNNNKNTDFITNNNRDTISDEIETASKNSEKELYFKLAENDRIILNTINEAFMRIEKGTYGKCEACNGTISIRRLEAIPWACYCFQCQMELERSTI